MCVEAPNGASGGNSYIWPEVETALFGTSNQVKGAKVSSTELGGDALPVIVGTCAADSRGAVAKSRQAASMHWLDMIFIRTTSWANRHVQAETPLPAAIRDKPDLQSSLAEFKVGKGCKYLYAWYRVFV